MNGDKGKNIKTELQRTRPDYMVYIPKSLDGATHDTGNEHFLVFDGPDGSLMAVWTQSTMECMPDQRLVFSRSEGDDKSWSKPRVIAGPNPAAKTKMCSWGFPLVSKTGRIYVLYNRHIGIDDIFVHTTGLMAAIYSDDNGRSWSSPQVIPMRRSIWDHPDSSVPANWIVWQKPERLSEGKYIIGFTRWVSKAVRHKPPLEHWTAEESVVEFMRFENIDDNPEAEDIVISNFCFNDEALRVGHPEDTRVSLVQEPSLVKLPDERLFCVMRTATGHPYYTVSSDEGKSWSQPEKIRHTDKGESLLHPCSPCPLYNIGDGQYIFLYHNHNGHFQEWGPLDPKWHRRPINISLGEFRSGAKQPVWFSEPKFLMDNDGIPLGYGEGRADLAMYASFTIGQHKKTLWYPERKFFLLGKNITGEFLDDLKVPQEAKDTERMPCA